MTGGENRCKGERIGQEKKKDKRKKKENSRMFLSCKEHNTGEKEKGV